MMTGDELISAAKELVLRELRTALPDGLTNVEVGRRTGLHVRLPNQSGYIQWTILQLLIEEGRVEKRGTGPGSTYLAV